MKVIKRDGSTCDFDRNKIAVAISKANGAVDPEDRVTEEQIAFIADDIASRHRRRVLVEDIQDMVEEKLMEMQKYQQNQIEIQEDIRRMQQQIAASSQAAAKASKVTAAASVITAYNTAKRK